MATKVPLTLPELRSWMERNLVHFSFKTVNSQASPGGIRLGADQALDLPYVSVRTLLSESKGVGMDYMSDGRNGRPFKQYQQGLGETPLVKDGPYQVDPDLVDLNGVLGATHAEFGTKNLSPRLRQILVPTSEGDYVALSPLGSSGLCEQVTAHVAARKAARKAFKDQPKDESQAAFAPWLIPRASQFSIGGSNPQNVGGRMRSMIPVVAQRFPTSSPQARQGWRLYHQGFLPRLPLARVRDYATWWRAHKEANRTWSLDHQAKEQALLLPLWTAIEAQAEEARRLIQREADTFEAVHEVTLFQSAWHQGWLFRERSLAWRDEVGRWLADQLVSFRLGVTEEGQAIRIGLAAEDAQRIHQLVLTEQLA